MDLQKIVMNQHDFGACANGLAWTGKKNMACKVIYISASSHLYLLECWCSLCCYCCCCYSCCFFIVVVVVFIVAVVVLLLLLQPDYVIAVLFTWLEIKKNWVKTSNILF